MRGMINKQSGRPSVPSDRSGSIMNLPRQDSETSLSKKSKISNPRPFERKPPARLKLSLMNKKFGSTFIAKVGETEDLGNTDEINSQDQIISIEN